MFPNFTFNILAGTRDKFKVHKKFICKMRACYKCTFLNICDISLKYNFIINWLRLNKFNFYDSLL